MADKVGDARKKHPVPLRLRNPFVGRDDGGSKGYRGPRFQGIKDRILKKARFRSSVNGADPRFARLQVDHIMPYRVGGLTQNTNKPTNLRVTDQTNNFAVDMATTFKERKVRRRLRRF